MDKRRPPSQGSTQVQGLEEIVVTAQRREESLQHAALAVTAVSGDELARGGRHQG